MKLMIWVALALLIPVTCLGQSALSSEQSMQAILTELRSIHADMRAETARSQSMQLLLAELQIESQAVARAVQRADAARTKTSEAQEGVRRINADITRAEDTQNTTTTEADKKRVASELDRLKDGLASMKRLEQDRSSSQQEADASLRKAQDAYDAIEDQLSVLMKTLRKE
jgi:hypothetical protein